MTLPRLRLNLDFIPSPVPDQPGLIVRDPFQYSRNILIIPPPLIACLHCFDGQHSALDLRAAILRATGEIQIDEIANQLLNALDENGFLQNEVFDQLRARCEKQFAESPLREPAHSGNAYPEDPGDLQTIMQKYLAFNGDGNSHPRARVGIAAPHVSPEGGWQSYRAAYRAMDPNLHDRTFVILGTSHYGQPDRFGLTRKPFATPFGTTSVDCKLVDQLAEEPAALMEDYCHAIEHSIEFQVVFLQALYGPDIRILPILCGSFARSILNGGRPEDDTAVESFLGRLGEIAAREGNRLFWLLGIDMAHMGRRYGDSFPALARSGEMESVAARDAARIERMNAGDPRGFWELVQQSQDDLKWCGSSPIYTFLKALPQARGHTANYEQWNIDAESVVSFAGVAFS